MTFLTKIAYFVVGFCFIGLTAAQADDFDDFKAQLMAGPPPGMVVSGACGVERYKVRVDGQVFQSRTPPVQIAFERAQSRYEAEWTATNRADRKKCESASPESLDASTTPQRTTAETVTSEEDVAPTIAPMESDSGTLVPGVPMESVDTTQEGDK